MTEEEIRACQVHNALHGISCLWCGSADRELRPLNKEAFTGNQYQCINVLACALTGPKKYPMRSTYVQGALCQNCGQTRQHPATYSCSGGFHWA